MSSCTRCRCTLMLADRGSLCNPCRRHVENNGDTNFIDDLVAKLDECVKAKDKALETLKALIPYVQMGFDYDGDVFKIAHNDAVDALNAAESLIAELETVAE